MDELGPMLYPIILIVCYFIAMAIPAPKPPTDTNALIAKIVQEVAKKL